MPGVKGRSGGHNAKPASEHAKDGTFRRDRHGSRTELHVEPASLVAPFEQDSEERMAWDRIVNTLPPEQITNLDFDKLCVYCEAWGQYRRVWPEFVKDPLDKDVRITALNLMDRVIALGREFGTSPMSRMSLKLPQEEKDDKDPLTEFLSRKKEKN
jgi:phage terminase small subunit